MRQRIDRVRELEGQTDLPLPTVQASDKRTIRSPREFIDRWIGCQQTERAAAQSHFVDLCALLDEPTPIEADPEGRDYAFEYRTRNSFAGDGFADVFKRHHFGWEYKRPKSDLNGALAQLRRYAPALDNPPLLIVSDIAHEFRIHTNITNTVARTEIIKLPDLLEGSARTMLKRAFNEPEWFRPHRQRDDLTTDTAKKIAALAESMRARGNDPREVAHFLCKLVFCMFAEDAGLLEGKLFERMIAASRGSPVAFEENARDLFTAMRKGGRVGFEKIRWFNGGLFADDTVIPLSRDEIAVLAEAAALEWDQIDSAIFGTLFERCLEPGERAPLGAHYTDRETLNDIVFPTIVKPLRREWRAVEAEVKEDMERYRSALFEAERAGERAASVLRRGERARTRARKARDSYLERLRTFRVLDPACGSGNFLAVALKELKDLERHAIYRCEALGLEAVFPRVGPETMLGLEINPYAAELARMSVWVSEIQWMIENGFGVPEDPVLKTVQGIEERDALLNADGNEAQWPEADAIVGNPPFLGGKRLRAALGDTRVNALFAAYRGRVPAEADLVTYWLEKAREHAERDPSVRVGLVTTNSVRGGANRKVVQRIVDGSGLVEAESDRPWAVDGAAVRVSALVFGARGENEAPRLDGHPVARINADLTAGTADLTTAQRLKENAGIAFMGDTKGGAFDVPGDLARRWLAMPTNPNGRPNADVVRPWINGMDVTRRPRDMWIVDFGWKMSEADAALYEAPFAHIEANVRPARATNKRELYRKNWWRHVEPRPGMWAALEGLDRYIVTPRVAKHRTFSWVDARSVPDSRLIAFATDDDVFFGILHSRFHELWSLRTGGWHGVGNDPQYTPTASFETFPFPEGFEPHIATPHISASDHSRSIAVAARELTAKRNAWLNPPELLQDEPALTSILSPRRLPVDADAAAELQGRTLTALYNQRPKWLADAHAKLDRAVANAYGWPADISGAEALHELLALNRRRAERSPPKKENAATQGCALSQIRHSGDRKPARAA